MSSRIANFLLKRLRREAARDALDLAISKRWLIEDGEEDRADEDGPRQVRVGHFFVEDDELGPERSSGRKLLFGSKLQGRSRAEIARLLKREGITLDAQAGNEDLTAAKDGSAARAMRRRTKASPARDIAADEADPTLIADVVRAIRASAAPPPVDEIAVVLLLAEGIACRGLDEDQVLGILNERQPVVSILCPVRGFETRFQIMLKNGGILPRPVALGSGPEMRGLHVSFVGTAENAVKLVLFPGRQFDADDPSRMDARVGQAAASGYPILGVAEKAERIPTALRVSASLDLECGPISTDLIASLMEEALGPVPGDVSLDALDADCAYLSLFDLPLAIRPGISHARVVEVLVRLGAARRKEHEEDNSSSREKSGWGSGSGSGKTSYRDRKVQGSGSDIISPVRAETIACDPFVPTVERLHGNGTASGWAMALKKDLELWQARQLDWSALSAKLLLSGPPGTGKTSFAKALCNTLQVPLIATSVSTWLEASYLGDVVRRMKAAFEEASEHAPCILFIDEIDGIGRREQGKDYDDYWNTIVNKALELLDGAVRSSGIVIVGATNHPDVIDPALLRSGRLETHIRIPPPDIDALAGILRHHLGNDFANVIASRPDVRRVVARTDAPSSSATDRPAPHPSSNHDDDHRDAGRDTGAREESPRGV